MAIILWDKYYTETLAETLDRFRLEKPEHKNEKVTYAGRLDPMAEGLVILLTAEDVHKKNEYLNLDKVYEVEFIFGPKTDTYDILGFVADTSKKLKNINESILEKKLSEKIGFFEQKYPPYSSKPVNGKPLFMWAREGKLNEIEIPSKKTKITKLELLEKKTIPFNVFKKDLIKNIEKVKGDFRQAEIIDSWKQYFSSTADYECVTVYSLRTHASSGTYMRSLVHDIGEKMGIPACTLKIKRTKVGVYSLDI